MRTNGRFHSTWRLKSESALEKAASSTYLSGEIREESLPHGFHKTNKVNLRKLHYCWFISRPCPAPDKWKIHELLSGQRQVTHNIPVVSIQSVCSNHRKSVLFNIPWGAPLPSCGPVHLSLLPEMPMYRMLLDPGYLQVTTYASGSKQQG